MFGFRDAGANRINAQVRLNSVWLMAPRLVILARVFATFFPIPVEFRVSRIPLMIDYCAH
jgi:hypothetical protein